MFFTEIYIMLNGAGVMYGLCREGNLKQRREFWFSFFLFLPLFFVRSRVLFEVTTFTWVLLSESIYF